jgi:uncharacterized DUF497 family protein
MYIVHDLPKFEWDDRKAASNKRKHRVSFEEAATALDDDALLRDDPDHTDYEARFILLGRTVSMRLLVVCHCYRKGGT